MEDWDLGESLEPIYDIDPLTPRSRSSTLHSVGGGHDALPVQETEVFRMQAELRELQVAVRSHTPLTEK